MLANYLLVRKEKAVRESWTYNSAGKTEEEKWQDGDKVQWEKYGMGAFSVNKVTIETGAFHGRTSAKSDYFYLIELGQGEFFFYKDENDAKPKKVFVKAGDCIRVKKGVLYDYQAQHQNLVATFFMTSR